MDRVIGIYVAVCLEEKGDVVVWWIILTVVIGRRIGEESMTDRFDEGDG